MNTIPPNSCKRIAILSEVILAHCEKYNIQIWAEDGTLIGLLRHDFIIPWDYDADFGLWDIDKQKFIQTWNQEKYPYYLDLNYYNNSGSFCILHSENDDEDGIDLVFYEIKDDKVVSTQSEQIIREYVSKSDYTYPIDLFFPLRETLFLGHRIYIFNDWNKILTIEYGDWQQIPDDKHNYIDQKFLQNPFQHVHKLDCKTFSELKACIQFENFTRKFISPFIVNNTDILQIDQQKFISEIKQEQEIFGYVPGTDFDYQTYPGDKIWDDYSKNKLQINIVDSPVTNQTILKDLQTDNKKYSLCWILTCAPKITYFHTDPDYGGGYMKLLEGNKIWWLVLKQDFEYLQKCGHEYKIMEKMNFIEILALENWYLWGKIYVAQIRKNDLIWFPERCFHRVITLESSFGFGGYI